MTIPRVVREASGGGIAGEDIWPEIGNAMIIPFVFLFSIIIAGTVISNSRRKNIGRNLGRMSFTMGIVSALSSVIVFLYPATPRLQYVFTFDGSFGWNGYLLYIAWASFQGACLASLVVTLKIRRRSIVKIISISLGMLAPALVMVIVETFYMPFTGYDTIAILITAGTFLAGGIMTSFQPKRPIKGKPLKRWAMIYIIAIYSSLGLLLAWFIIFGASNFYQLYYHPYEVPKTGLSTGELILSITIPVFACVVAISVLATVQVLNVKERVTVRKRILKKSLTMTAAIVGVVAIVASAPLSYFSSTWIPFWSYKAGPYLTWADGQDPATSISVCWRTPRASGTSMRYGTNPNDLALTAGSADRGMLHALQLSGLSPNTTYYYRVGGFDLKEFTTAPTSNSSFAFSVWSDPRTNNGYAGILDRPNMPSFIDGMADSAGVTLDFSICTGDLVGRGPAQDSWKLWLSDITTNDFASNASHVVAIGNHERYDDITAINFHRYYPYMNTTFSFDYAQLHVIILDIWTQTVPEEPWWTEVPNHLMTWMEQDLLASTATFNILALHPTPINYDGSPTNDSHNGDIGVAIMNLADNFGLDAVFSGHSHRYTHALHNNTHYFTIGIGGNENNNFIGDAGFAMVSVVNSNMTIDLYQVSSESIFESYSILK
ncbi:MAG: fibronectin type III domain-containing protein [Promethearchaeota archaeon]